jgi:hypothetical protein
MTSPAGADREAGDSFGGPRYPDPAGPRSSEDRAEAFEASCGGSIPPGAITVVVSARHTRVGGALGNFGIVVGIALILAGIGFAVLAWTALRGGRAAGQPL